MYTVYREKNEIKTITMTSYFNSYCHAKRITTTAFQSLLKLSNNCMSPRRLVDYPVKDS